MTRARLLPAADAWRHARAVSVAITAAALFFGWGMPSQPVFADDGPAVGLAVTLAPPLLVADGASQPVLYVQLLGADGHPVVASEPVEVALFSSNPASAQVPGRVQIPPSSSYVIAPVTTTLAPGVATITAVGAGKSSQGVEVKTVASGSRALPVGVQLHVAPPTLLSGGEPAGQLAVLLVNGQGEAVKAQ